MKHAHKIIICIFGFLFFYFFTVSQSFAQQQTNNFELKRIYTNIGQLEPEFSPTRHYYVLTTSHHEKVPIIQATAKSKEATVTISGNKNLQEGENIIKILVTDPNNTSQEEYIINLIKSDTPNLYDTTLTTLIVDGYPFEKEFTSYLFHYNVPKHTQKNYVDVYAYPNNENASVTISGNTNLQDGENKIEVTVTSENKKASKTYTISIQKDSTKTTLKNKKSEIIKTNSISTPSQNTTKENTLVFSKIKFSILFTLLFAIILIFLFIELKK